MTDRARRIDERLDVERGTFSQRHLVLHDVKTGQRVSPIQSGDLAPFSTAPSRSLTPMIVWWVWP